jgi:hypothetical protein
MTLEVFVTCVRDWQARLTPEQARACAAGLIAMGIVDDLPRGTGVETALAMMDGHAPSPPLLEATAEDITPPAVEPEAAPQRKRESKKAKSGVGMEMRGRPSKRAQALVREQLEHGPKPGEQVAAAAHLADIPERSLIAAADALGVRTRKGE